ncbi:hypothetical protein BHQ15_12155 [Mycolicibacillus koreensis]|nr:hypothetical protein BHQ15_12155 [Mycolicibacillus koreensis]
MRTALVVVGGVLGWLCGASALPIANADPAAGTDSAVDPYLRHTPDGSAIIEFSTPDGVRCNFHPASSLPDATSSQVLVCRGEFPGVVTDPTASELCVKDEVRAFNSLTYRFASDFFYSACDEEPAGPLLPVGATVSDGNISCAVSPGDVTACVDTRLGEQHGFILQPSGSTAF